MATEGNDFIHSGLPVVDLDGLSGQDTLGLDVSATVLDTLIMGPTSISYGTAPRSTTLTTVGIANIEALEVTASVREFTINNPTNDFNNVFNITSAPNTIARHNFTLGAGDNVISTNAQYVDIFIKALGGKNKITTENNNITVFGIDGDDTLISTGIYGSFSVIVTGDNTTGRLVDLSGSVQNWNAVSSVTFQDGLGNDTLISDRNLTYVHGAGGIDHIFLDLSNDHNKGNEYFSGPSYASFEYFEYLGSDEGEAVASHSDNTTLRGEGGDDLLAASIGSNWIYGGTGNDVIRVKDLSLTDHHLFGGEGFDVIEFDYASATEGVHLQRVQAATFGTSIEGFSGHLTRFDDSIEASVLVSNVYGGEGEDTLFLDFSDFSDFGRVDVVRTTLDANGYAAQYLVRNGAGKLITVASGDIRDFEHIHITGSAAGDSLLGGSDQDTIYGGGGNDSLLGREGDDLIYGGDGNDIISWSVGNDTLFGGAGDDDMGKVYRDSQVDGGTGIDTAYFVLGPNSGGPNFVFAERNWTSIEGIKLRANALDNNLNMGNVLAGKIEANAGFDILTLDYTLAGEFSVDHVTLRDEKIRIFIDGRVGFQKLEISSFEVVNIKGSLGDDSLRLVERGFRFNASGEAGNDTLESGRASDKLFGGAGDDVLLSNAGHDRLDGGRGHDALLGGEGNDTMLGGAGRDLFVFAGWAASGRDRVLDFSVKDVLWVGGDLTDDDVETIASARGTLIRWGEGSVMLVGYRGEVDLRFNEDFDRQSHGEWNLA